MPDREAENGDDGRPWRDAKAANEQPFYGDPIRCGVLVSMPSSVCMQPVPVIAGRFPVGFP